MATVEITRLQRYFLEKEVVTRKRDIVNIRTRDDNFDLRKINNIFQ